MKKIIILLVIYTCCSCVPKTSIMAENGSNIEQAYYEKWVAGVRGGGKGMNFYLDLKSAFPKNTQLKKLIFRGYEVDFIKQDELHYKASIITTDISEENPNQTVLASPQVKSKLKDNEAFFLFEMDGRSAQQKYINVIEKAMLLYPLAR